ncbi:hypothetical protein L6164_017485 [Bauhinia variegata]|uniref:Uncharacterized protein n=1 Tax=Bauhinia variegata TaxID=167791 RepID=A0ACB9N9Z7_BAUVA|nr:hypothetical protein L6164_017485 [Bauhinia variegata]
MIDEDGRLLKAAITKGWLTLLHVAAGVNHVHFVDELVKLLDTEDLELQDFKGNTAFCFAAAVGNMRIAEIMMRRCGKLPQIRGGAGVTPLHMAALQGSSEMAKLLFPLTKDIFQETDWTILFFICLNGDLYDLALQAFEKMPVLLALARDGNYEMGLHVLARKPSAFHCHGQGCQKQPMNSNMKLNMPIKLVRCLWRTILLNYPEQEMRSILSQPSLPIFSAAEVGNFEFVAELLGSYPDFVWEVDDKNLSIIHIAVLHRHASIFNLIHEIGSTKNFIVTYEDKEKNNLLHCAAKLAPPNQLNFISGAAFQMMHELLWFEEVKKVMLPSDIEKKNCHGKTPRELFTEEHEKLLTKAESWMKGTAKSCMLVSTLITTGVFTAAFGIPGGNDDKTGDPSDLNTLPFLIFAISDAAALMSSSTSILIFLSILISRYAEDDFLVSLPLQLIFGLVALFISIASMMIAFSSAFFISYYHGLKLGVRERGREV